MGMANRPTPALRSPGTISASYPNVTRPFAALLPNAPDGWDIIPPTVTIEGTAHGRARCEFGPARSPNPQPVRAPMTIDTIPVDTQDPINARILSISED